MILEVRLPSLTPLVIPNGVRNLLFASYFALDEISCAFVVLSGVGAHATTQSKDPAAASCDNADTRSSTEIADRDAHPEASKSDERTP